MPVMLVQGEARRLPLRDGSVHCVVTSPPYYGLRDYQTGHWVGGEAGCTHIARTARNDVDEATLARRAAQYGTGTQAGSKVAPIQYTGACPHCGAVRVDQQIGLEPLHDCLAWARQEPPCAGCWVCSMRVVFKEVHRVMRPEATLWLNVGDSYVGGNQGGTYNPATWQPLDGSGGNATWTTRQQRTSLNTAVASRLKPKNLLGMPWRLALALQADGFILRSEIIWEKPSCMPESVADRFTRSHEQVFLFAKQARYYFDATAVRESAADWGLRDRALAKHNTEGFRANGQPPHRGLDNGNWAHTGRNARTVWRIASEPLTGFQHYAAFPTELVRKCLLAGAPAQVCTKCSAPWVRQVERSLHNTAGWGMAQKDHTGPLQGSNAVLRNGQGRAGDSQTTTLGFLPTCACAAPTRKAVVLDPFAGSATTGLVARELGHDAVCLDLSLPYLRDIARERLGLTALHRWTTGATPQPVTYDDLPLFAKD